MAARSIASVYVSFGLVNIPVRVYSANQTSESVSFHLLHKKCGTRLKQQYICPKDREIVEREDMVKGYEWSKDQYVLFNPEELKALEEDPTKTIAITEFVPQDKVDALYFEKAYYLGPDKGGERAYKLLGEAMKKSGLVGVAQYAARGKAYIVLLRPLGPGLVMQQLRYSEEVRPMNDVPLPEKVDIKDAELKLALQLIEQCVSKTFDPDKYSDSVKERVMGIIQKKVEGQEITMAPTEHPQAQVIDLMEALKASLGVAGEAAASGGAKASITRKPAKPSPRQADKKAEPAPKKKAK